MIDLTTAKAHLRVDIADEDVLIGAYLAAAISAVENATSKPLVAREVTQLAAGFPCDGRGIRLWYGPVSGDVTIDYDDASGVAQVLTDYRLVEGSNAQLLPAYGTSFPITAFGAGAVKLTYTAGYGEGDVPTALEQAVLLLTGHFYANREAVVAGTAAQAAEMPLAVDMLIAPYRPVGLG
jgi:uncharacterized phiE125 gp8 family phage protein